MEARLLRLDPEGECDKGPGIYEDGDVKCEDEG